MCWTVLSGDVATTRAGNVLPHLKTGLQGYWVTGCWLQWGMAEIFGIFMLCKITPTFCFAHSVCQAPERICLLPIASSMFYLKKSLSSLSSHPRISDKISFYGQNYFLNPTIFDSKGKQESPGEDWQDPAHRATVTCDGWTWGHLDSVVVASLH